VTVVAVLSAYVAMAAFNLATNSARTRPRSFTSMPCALAHSRTAVGFSRLTDALLPSRADRLPPPARRAAATQRASVSRSARHADGQVDLGPGAARPEADGAFALTAVKVIDQQNVYLLSHICLFRSLGWRWRIGLASSIRAACSNTGRLGRCKPTLAAAYSSRPRSAVFPGGCTVNGRTDATYHGTRHDLSLTTVRQAGREARSRHMIAAEGLAVGRMIAAYRRSDLLQHRLGDCGSAGS